MEKMEAGFRERMGKMELEVSQLREAFTLSGEASRLHIKSEQASPKRKLDEAPPKSKADETPPKSKADQAPAKRKVEQAPAKKKEIDAAMYVFRERTSLKRWRPHRVAFMTVVFSNMIKKEYGHLEAQGRKSYMLHNLLLQYGKGVLPPHGRTHEIWNIDVDRLYVPVHVSGNHWIALCISFVTRSIDVFDCSGRKMYKEVDGFANLIPRIVKAVQPMRHQKDFAVGAYTVSYVPVRNLNKSACDCGVYAVNFIECHALGLELSLLHDGNIIEAHHMILWDLWEAANDPELIDRMSKYQSPECLSSTVEEIL
ncbi:hypothetical protein F2Q70_00035260 [Brassica cretica]|uniref:Ubiquitin-like protease family profile domain-containing protein n=1 Tax=Brassica cretica TaxID=69181 RepID=A0A8S9JQC4_BRACR|nr:hypothetical protein F2Q70_00035260 [Brassica cretica]